MSWLFVILVGVSVVGLVRLFVVQCLCRSRGWVDQWIELASFGRLLVSDSVFLK